MNFFDSSIINFFNKFSQQSWVFDNISSFLAGNNLVKGGIFTIAIWWLWFKTFKTNEEKSDVRERIISIILSCLTAVLLARTLALLLPYRERPLHEVALNFILPFGMDSSALTTWSSFPSDHAVLFFALCTGLLFISKKIGIYAFIYTTIFIALPRVYLGLHYPTDIICGGLLGIAIAWFANQNFVRTKISKPILSWTKKTPGLFYALFFLITYQIADLFDASRSFIHFAMQILKHII
jgi:undecaprenyl-diphosphatase